MIHSIERNIFATALDVNMCYFEIKLDANAKTSPPGEKVKYRHLPIYNWNRSLYFQDDMSELTQDNI
jgi:hypothetical protein